VSGLFVCSIANLYAYPNNKKTRPARAGQGLWIRRSQNVLDHVIIQSVYLYPQLLSVLTKSFSFLRFS